MVIKGRSQIESEAPAKVYQLDALDSKLDSYQLETNEKLDTLLNQTKGVITIDQAHAMIKESEIEVRKWVESEVQKIHLEYGPTKKGAWWVGGVIVTAVIGQFIILIFKPFG